MRVALFSGLTRVSTVPAGSFPKAVSVGAKTVKGPAEVERIDQAGGFYGCDESFVDRRVDCVLDDGLGGIHVGAADLGVFDVGCGAGEG